MGAKTLSAYGLRAALRAGIQRVISQREEINRINIFPVADHDTGTNMAFTLVAVLQGMGEMRCVRTDELFRQVAEDAMDGARGNAGAILAHFFFGLTETLEPGVRLTAPVLAAAVAGGSARARASVAEPCEGTILSVMWEFAEEMQAQARDERRDIRECFQSALQRAREALQRTTVQLKMLKSYNVVDAGGCGFVELLEGIAEWIKLGRGAMVAGSPEELLMAGIEVFSGQETSGKCRYTVECVVSAETVDRKALRAALRMLPLAHAVFEGSRSRVRVHARVEDPQLMFSTTAQFGSVLQASSEELLAPSPITLARRQRVAIVADSGADIPAEAIERLDIHIVPQRLSIGGRDFVDGVSISPSEFYHEMRTNPILPRTSQPPPGDFRRMFEFLLKYHEQVIDVSLSRSLSGTLQGAESAGKRVSPKRVSVIDSFNAAAGQGLLVIWAAEAALAGLTAEHILEGLTQMRTRTEVYAVIRDIRYGVRGGRVPRVALPLTRLLRLSLMIMSRANGRLGLMGGLWGGGNLPESFARKVAGRLNPKRRYRFIVGHCDCASDAERVRAALVKCVRDIDRVWLVETGVAIGAHAGPGSLVIGVQDYEPAFPL